ncbi:MAG: protein-glutamate O-methyltransferase CheR, partial [Bacteroidota bacterium]|nr:protein-glutamate O-methyltransferase CheR [Bacteroidota bacterium]
MSTETAARHLGTTVSVAAVFQKIDALLGLRYQAHQWSDLLRLLKPAARELGYDEVDEFLTNLVHGEQDARHADVLARHLTIGESYFFREIVVFSILRERILPELVERKESQGDRTLRVWSAGCSTGEEVYSIAILLEAIIADRSGWRYEVLGTDVNPSAIQRAREGVYRDWSFRDVPLDLHAAYFEQTAEGKHAVIARIKENTEFRVLNLVNTPTLFPSGFDIIFCRNVLLYFTRDKVNGVVQGFRRALREHGWLIPSLTETTLINNPGFEGARFGDATLYRKQAHIPRLFTLRPSRTEEDRDARSSDAPPPAGHRNPFTALISSRGAESQPDPNPVTETADRVSADRVSADRVSADRVSAGHGIAERSASGAPSEDMAADA